MPFRTDAKHAVPWEVAAFYWSLDGDKCSTSGSFSANVNPTTFMFQPVSIVVFRSADISDFYGAARALPSGSLKSLIDTVLDSLCIASLHARSVISVTKSSAISDSSWRRQVSKSRSDVLYCFFQIAKAEHEPTSSTSDSSFPVGSTQDRSLSSCSLDRSFLSSAAAPCFGAPLGD